MNEYDILTSGQNEEGQGDVYCATPYLESNLNDCSYLRKPRKSYEGISV
jgi:hypothetical protein